MSTMTIDSMMFVIVGVMLIVNMLLTSVLLPVIIIMLVEYRSFNKSTHKIEYVQPPISPIIDDGMVEEGLSEKEFNKMMEPDDEFLE